MALIVENEKIVGKIDNLQDKLERFSELLEINRDVMSIH